MRAVRKADAIMENSGMLSVKWTLTPCLCAFEKAAKELPACKSTRTPAIANTAISVRRPQETLKIFYFFSVEFLVVVGR